MVVWNNLIPFKGFGVINLFGVLFARRDCYKNETLPRRVINHESIHTEQMKELGYVFFYIWYFIEWLIQLCLHGKDAYYWISFEREAYNNETNNRYFRLRKRYNWFKYYGKN